VTLLLVDIGNTRIKWARLADGRMGEQQAAGHAGWKADEYARHLFSRLQSPGDRVVVSSVAGEKADRLLIDAARRAKAPAPEFVTSQRQAAGVMTTYNDPWRLGVDRFVGVIGAYHLASGRPACVVNVGTAITIDLVDVAGVHRGGVIIPGPALMVDSLLSETSGIRQRAQGGPDGKAGFFARTTRAAITGGSRYAAAAIIDRALEEAYETLKEVPLALLTGGGSAEVKPLVRNPCVRVADLVLHGLAVWANRIPPPQPPGGGTKPVRTRVARHTPTSRGAAS
jgi:type III pantothenate kinase